ncbi:MAG: Crp/Fnr family transcriptional regulator [Ruminococcus sp.]|jgi:CRP-like cAMP-binding protein
MLLTPTYIFSDDFTEFETYFLSHPHRKRFFCRGDYLWKPDEPFGKIHYILSGTIQNSLEHDSGKRKIISFHGKGTLFPGYHQKHYKIEKSLVSVALFDTEVIEFTQEQFYGMFHDNHKLQDQVIDWYSFYSNLLLFEAAHQDYNSTFVKLCNLLYLILVSENGRQNYLGDLTQDTLAEILGVSLVNLTRALTQLRNEGIITTGRKRILVLDENALKAYCSYETM